MDTLKVELVQVSLTPEEQRSFVQFRRYQTIFERLVSHGVFEIRGGYFSVHMDNDGNPRTVAKYNEEKF